MQFVTEKVNLKFFALIRVRLLHVANILAKLAEEVTAVVVNAGTDESAAQPLNMADMFVTAEVLNNGTDVKIPQA